MWFIHDRTDQCTEFGNPVATCIYSLPKVNCSIFVSRKGFGSKQCIHPLCNRVTPGMLFSRLDSNPLPWMTWYTRWKDDEEGADACFGLAFAAGLPVLIREFCIAFESRVTGSPVPAKVSSLSSWIRTFSVRSLTNVLSPLEILIHERDPPPDEVSILISTPCAPW